MKSVRYAAGLPFVAAGFMFAWLGVLVVQLGYFIGGREYDPIELFDREVSEPK